MTYQTLIYSVEKDIVRITINRPAQLNAIDVLTAKELALAAKQCSADPAVRCVVLTGAGDRAFCAGGDVAGFASDPERVDSLIEEGSDLRVRAHAGDAHRRSKRHGSWRRPRPRGGRRSRCRFPVGKIHQRLHEDRANPRREHDLVHACPA
jgi:enoyl-CoA hydratase/carnithine racemase